MLLGTNPRESVACPSVSTPAAHKHAVAPRCCMGIAPDMGGHISRCPRRTACFLLLGHAHRAKRAAAPAPTKPWLGKLRRVPVGGLRPRTCKHHGMCCGVLLRVWRQHPERDEKVLLLGVQVPEAQPGGGT